MLRIFVFLALSLFTLPLFAQDDAADPAGYQDAIQMAVEEFSAGRWAEARALFQKAHALSPNARTFRGLGMTNFELREYIDALGYLNAALYDTRKPLTDEQKKQTQELIDRARLYVGQFQVTLTPPEATVLVDRAPVDVSSGFLFLKIGDHEVTARAAGYDDLVMPIKVQGGENVALPLTLTQSTQAAVAPVAAPLVTPPPADATQGQPPPATAERSSGAPSAWAWVTAVGATVFVGAGVALKIHGNNSFEKLEIECGMFCTDEQKKDSGIETADALMVASFVTAGVLATTSVLLFILTSGSDESASAPTAQLGIGPGSVRLSGSF